MKKNKALTKLIPALAILLTLSGCADFLNEKLQLAETKQQIDAAIELDNPANHTEPDNVDDSDQSNDDKAPKTINSINLEKDEWNRYIYSSNLSDYFKGSASWKTNVIAFDISGTPTKSVDQLVVQIWGEDCEIGLTTLPLKLKANEHFECTVQIPLSKNLLESTYYSFHIYYSADVLNEPMEITDVSIKAYRQNVGFAFNKRTDLYEHYVRLNSVLPNIKLEEDKFINFEFNFFSPENINNICLEIVGDKDNWRSCYYKLMGDIKEGSNTFKISAPVSEFPKDKIGIKTEKFYFNIRVNSSSENPSHPVFFTNFDIKVSLDSNTVVPPSIKFTNDGWAFVSEHHSLNKYFTNNDWKTVNWKNQVLEIKLSAKPSHSINSLSISSWSDSQDDSYNTIFDSLIATNLRANEPFETIYEMPLSMNIDSSKTYSFNFYYLPSPDNNVTDFSLEDYSISVTIKNKDFLLAKNCYNNCSHTIRCKEIVNNDSLEQISVGKYVNLHMSFNSPQEIAPLYTEIIKDSDEWVTPWKYNIGQISQGMNDITISYPVQQNSDIPDEGFNLKACRFNLWYNIFDENYGKQNPQNSIYLTDFNIELSVTDEPLYYNWTVKDSTLTIFRNSAFDNLDWSYTFWDCSGIDSNTINSVIIKESVTYIPPSAFRQGHLISVTLPQSLTLIGNCAFQDNNISELTIPSSVTNIGTNCFNGTHTIILDWDSTDTTERVIDPNAFDLVNSVRYSDGVFYTGKSYTYTIDGDIMTISGTGEIEENAFYIHEPMSLLENVREIIIEDGITKISRWAFNSLFDVTSIIIPPSVTEIESDAFSGGDSSTIITLDWPHDDITERNIAEDAFDRFNSVRYSDGVFYTGKSYTYTIDGDIMTISGTGEIVENAFYIHEPMSLLENVREIIIEDGITKICRLAFNSLFDVTSIIIPPSVTEIESDAFSGGHSSTIITLDWPHDDITERNIAEDAFDRFNSVRYSDGVIYTGKSYTYTIDGDIMTISGTGEIEENAFYIHEPMSLLENVREIIIEDGITKICRLAFNSLFDVTSIIIPPSVTEIESDAFSGGDISTIITLDWPHDDITERNIAEDAFDLVNSVFYSDGVFYTGKSYYYIISGAGGEILEIFGTGKIEDFAFDCFSDSKFNKQSFENITSIIIHEGITEIGINSFFNCYNVTSIQLPSTLSSINNSAFYGNGFSSVTIPSSVTFIGENAFTPSTKDSLEVILDWSSTAPARDINSSAFVNSKSVKYNDGVDWNP